jgi:hypothetical protein
MNHQSQPILAETLNPKPCSLSAPLHSGHTQHPPASHLEEATCQVTPGRDASRRGSDRDHDTDRDADSDTDRDTGRDKVRET